MNDFKEKSKQALVIIFSFIISTQLLFLSPIYATIDNNIKTSDEPNPLDNITSTDKANDLDALLIQEAITKLRKQMENGGNNYLNYDNLNQLNSSTNNVIDQHIIDKATELRNQPRRHPGLTAEEALRKDFLNDDLQYLVFGEYVGHTYYDGVQLVMKSTNYHDRSVAEIAVLTKGFHPDLKLMTNNEQATFSGESRREPAITAFRLHANAYAINRNGFRSMFDWFEVRINNGPWQVAFCMNFNLPSPLGMHHILSTQIYNNNLVRRALWYGYGGGSGHWPVGVHGPGGANGQQRRLNRLHATTRVLTFITTGNYPSPSVNHPSSSHFDAVRDLWNRVNAAPNVSPHGHFDLNRGDGQTAMLETYIHNSTTQRSETVTIRGWNENLFTIPVPAGVDLINTSRSGGTVRNRNNEAATTATVRGGETIRFETAPTSNINVRTGNIRGSVQPFQPLRSITTSSVQNLGMSLISDPITPINIQVNFRPVFRNVTIRHMVKESGLILQTDNLLREESGRDYWLDGDIITSTVTSEMFLLHEEIAHRIIGGTTSTITQTVNGDTTITHYYEPERFLTAIHINRLNETHELGRNRVYPDNGHWWDGMNITGSSQPQIFNHPFNSHQAPARTWQYEETIDHLKVFDGTNLTITHNYRRPVNVEKRHINDETDEIIRTTQIRTHYADELVRAYPLWDLKSQDTTGYLMIPKPDSVAPQTRIMQDEDVLEIFNFNYTIPTLEINVESMEITTGQNHMQALLTLSHAQDSQELGEIDYRVTIKNQETELTTTTQWRNHQDFQAVKTINLPTGDMELGADANLSVSIELRQPNNEIPRRLQTQTTNLKTRGYRSSERTLTNADINDGKVSYTAPARTIVTRIGSEFSEVDVQYETVSFGFTDVQKTHTGYGIYTPFDLQFTSQINDHVDHLAIDLITNVSLADNYIYEEFDIQEELMTVNLEQTKRSVIDETTIEYGFEFQNVFVQRAGRGLDGSHDFINGGEIFSQRQVDNQHPSLINELRNGYRRFYIPIWHDLGVYEFNYISNEIGRNLISFDMIQEIDVFAFMYAWIGSPTIEDDALLMVPVFSCTVNPPGWTDEMIEWLRGEQCEINPGGFGH